MGGSVLQVFGPVFVVKFLRVGCWAAGCTIYGTSITVVLQSASRIVVADVTHSEWQHLGHPVSAYGCVRKDWDTPA
jgi:hypothetical protein